MPRGVEVINLKKAIDQVEREKGIDRQILIDAVEAAILSAARKKLGHLYDLEARFNEETDEVEVFRWVRVVDEVNDPHREVALADARERLDSEADIDDELGEKLDTSTFGRIAAQTAKQIIIQRVRRAEREMIFNEYKDRVGELATGVVRRFERRQQDVVVDLGRAEAVLQRNEQIPKENYRIGDRIQAYIKRVRDEDKQPLITLSRTDEGFLIKLFEMEVPEIYEGIVRIVGAARDPGIRAKIAVSSRDHEVDPVGACVGVKGARVQAVVQELRGEKIDIVPYSEDPARFVCNAIAPAQVSRVIIDEERGSMELIVPDDQQSLAIGRKGQNVRLAVKLTGWDLNIVSEQEVSQRQEETLVALSTIRPELTREMLMPIFKLGYRSPQDIIKAEVGDLAIIPGIGPDNAELIKKTAQEVLDRIAQGEPLTAAVAAEITETEAEATEAAVETAAEATETTAEAAAEAETEAAAEVGTETAAETTETEAPAKAGAEVEGAKVEVEAGAGAETAVAAGAEGDGASEAGEASADVTEIDSKDNKPTTEETSTKDTSTA